MEVIISAETMERVEDALAHHGIKGMKWGVRKSTGSGGSGAATDTKPKPKRSTEAEGRPKGSSSSDGRIKKGAPPKVLEKPKTQHSMSDEELRQAINRINMERQFAQLTHKPTKGDAARKFVTDLLVDVGKKKALEIALHQTGKLLESKGLVAPKKKKDK